MALECGDTSKASASFGSNLGGDQGNLAPGSLSTGSPAGRTPLLLKRGDGSMHSLAYVRARFFASTSVAVRDRGHRRGVCGKRVHGAVNTSNAHTGGKVVAPGYTWNGRVSR